MISFTLTNNSKKYAVSAETTYFSLDANNVKGLCGNKSNNQKNINIHSFELSNINTS